jgi:hypothetical protein
VVLKYLEGRINLLCVKLGSRHRLHILCKSDGYLLYTSRRKYRDWQYDGLGFVLYLMSDFLSY